MTSKANPRTLCLWCSDKAQKGKITMKEFKNSDYESVEKQYETEAKRLWGDIDAYKEYTEKRQITLRINGKR